MSKANMCSTANYSVDDVKVNIENEIESLKKTINFQTNVCSESPTILITNYAHSNESIDTSTNTLSFNANPKSSIAIYTRKSDSEKASNSAAPSINILINNHFDHPASTKTTTTNASLNPIHNSKTIKIERDTSDDAATTEIDDFWLEEMILAKHEDGRSYVGQVIEINRPANYIRIKFDDRSERSLPSEEIRKLNSLADDQLLCIVCKQSDNTAIRSCARCFRASHKKCMEGNRDDKTGVWHCERCMNKIRIFSKKIKLICNENSGNQLSYDVNELTWDAQHQRNVEEIYCYCGKKGKWYMQMLQCVRCQQWFHANCVKCLNFPLYFGDRFYLFACSICNHGTEFIRRLSMTIDDVVQLMLFNLTLHHKRNYFSLSNVIYPYIRDNWNALQLPQKLRNMMNNDVRDEINKTLRLNPKRFKAGQEVKKKVLTWSLKTRAPPKASRIALLAGPQITEKYLNELFSEQARIHFVSQNSNNESIQTDAKMRNLMIGKSYTSFIEECELDSSCSDAESDKNALASSASDDEYLTDMATRDERRQIIGSDEYAQSENTVGGYESIFVRGNKRNGNVEMKKRGRPLKNDRRSDVAIDLCDSSDDTSSRGTLDSIIPPLKDFSGSNNPFLFDSNSCSNGANNTTSTSTAASSSGLNFSNSFSKIGSNGVAYDKTRIVRTVKRRLSAKDILIGPNMEVKRRKLKRRKDDNVEVISTTTIAELTSAASYLPMRFESKDISLSQLRSSLNNSVSSLRRSMSNNGTESKTSLNDESGKSVIDQQPQKTLSLGQEIASGSAESQKSSTNLYLGSVDERIAKGERFVIHGKRILSDGRQQYLIEWES